VALATTLGLAQQQQQPQSQQRKIYLLHANTLSFDKRQDPDRQTLRGDVQFRQDSCYMYCDSAYFYENSNSMAAFGHVKMRQSDTLFVYCDSMFYDGDAMFGELYDNVHLIHHTKTANTNLYTSYMTYDRELEEANYPERGVMVDSLVHLRSLIGWYYPQQKLAFFQYDVEGRTYDRNDQWKSVGRMPSHDYDPDDERLTPKFKLYSDTLRYDFINNLATVLGPSRIVNDSSTVHTRRGHFNTKTELAHLYERSWIESPGRHAIADTLFYNVKEGYGEAWGDIYAIDTTDNMAVKGDYAYYIESDTVPQMGFITGHALAMEFSSGDTLYLHADTLRAYTVFDHILADTLSHTEAIDTLGNTRLVIDSIMPEHTDTLRYMHAYHGVRYYRSDLQGVCDSLIYSVRDSLATFMGSPVMWNNQYQIRGDTIFAVVTREGIHRAMIHPNAFLTQSHDESLKINSDTLTEAQRLALRIDSLHYDQIIGNDLVCYFDSGKVSRMDMSGNVKIIYYPEESDKSLIGLNQMIGNYLTVWFKNQKMEKLKLWPQVVGSLTPIQLVTEDILYLDNFRWMSYLRPAGPRDVFRGIEMKKEDKVEVPKLFNDDELNGY
jgi:lipopolysaccharide export system protein LptA